jgi:hypothetical protein
MLFSTFLTLVLVPVVYTLLARFTRVHAVQEVPGVETKTPRVGPVTPATAPS